MTCRWIFPCRRTPTVYYLGGFFCSYHARLIQGFRASRQRDGGTQPPKGPVLGGVAGRRDTLPPGDPASIPITAELLADYLPDEAELFDILERDYWQDADV
jgi:hypothetical protein